MADNKDKVMDDIDDMKDEPKEEPKDTMPVETKKDEDISGDGGIIKTIIKEGTGWEKPEKGSDVKVHYVGTLLDGTLFDSSRTSGKEFDFVVGVGQVIKGWDKGVATMKKGEIAKFVIKPDYGYGANGAGDKIPPNATLVFEVELISFSIEKDLTTKKDGGVLKKIIKDVDGWEKPNEDAKVRFHYIGKLKSTGKVFENTREIGNPVEIIMGADEAPNSGLEIAVESMKKGEIASVIIKPEYGYGKEGNPIKGIPPNATLLYEIELVEFEKAREPWDMEFPEKIEVAKRKKEEGNDFYKIGKFQKAIKKYKKAARFFENDAGLTEEQKKTAETVKVPCYLNTAICKLKVGDYQDALKNCEDVLKTQPDNVKALFRKGQALNCLDVWDEATKILTRTLELDPQNGDAKKELAKIKQKRAQQDQKDKKIYAGIFERLSKMPDEPATTTTTPTTTPTEKPSTEKPPTDQPPVDTK